MECCSRGLINAACCWVRHTSGIDESTQAGGPKHRASFSSIYLPDTLVIAYKSLLKDIQKGRVNTSPKHTITQTKLPRAT